MRLPGYELLPFEGLAEARLGEDRATLQKRLGEHRVFRKGTTRLGLAEQYAERGLILHYDDRGLLHYLEVSDTPIHYRGVQLLERPYGEVRAELAALGCRYVEDDGCEFPDLGFNLWPGDLDEPVIMVGMFAADRRGQVGDFVRVPEETEPVRHHVLLPHVGTEQVRLGADRHALRRLLGTCMEVVPEYGPAAAEDHYILHGLTLDFDAADRLIAIAVASLAETVTYEGVQLLMRPYEQVVADLSARGVRVEHGELIGRAPGFSLLLAGDAGPHLPVATVYVA